MMSLGRIFRPSLTTNGDLVFLSQKRMKKKENTIRRYEALVKLYLKPCFGHRQAQNTRSPSASQTPTRTGKRTGAMVEPPRQKLPGTFTSFS